MEMESSRRPVEKPSREQLAYKKPRLVEEPAERNPRFSGTAGFASSRVRAVERDGKGRNGVVAEETKDREDSGRGGTLHLQELLSQYKAALGELTFNSKPIITNLTIIAGENTSAVMGIAATICTNIIEVPGDQKLPSLYLLDSIVKNIGGDYVKYFATKLPEVFVKAYRQVDPSIYPSMQHLFKTWRGVFPPEPLRFIEKELGFPPVVNSSPGASSVARAEPQSQRPAHSIHVNPKYLEARQRLQQAGKVKGGGSENSTSSLSDDSERPEHPSTSGASKPWPESSAKSGNRPQRVLYSSESLLTKRPASRYPEYDIGSGAAIKPDLGGRRLSARVAEPDESAENPWYHGGEDTAMATDPEKRNGYDMPRLPPRGVTNVNKTSGSSRSDRLAVQANPARSTVISHGLSRSWKNSDEEEFLWDEMNSKSSEYRLNDGPKREDWSRDETEASSAFQYQKPLPTVKSEISNVNWGGLGTMPSRRKLAGADRRFSPEMELDDLSHEPPNWKDIGNRDKESLSELFSTRQGSEDFAGRQPGHVSSDQHSLPSSRSQAPSNDIATISASMNSNQLNGKPYIVGTGASSNLPLVNKIGYRPVAGPSVPSFGSSLNGMIGHQRQQYQKPPSPSSQVHQYPNSPVSTVISQPPFEQQQLTHFRDQDHLLGSSFTVSGHHKIPPVQEQANPTQIPGNLETLSFSSQKDNTGGSLTKPLALQTLKFPHSSPTVTSHPPLPHLEPSPQLPHIQPYGQLYQQSLQPTNYGSHQSLGFSKTMNLQGQSDVDSLLATILKSGVPSSQPPGSSDMPMLNSSFTPLNALEFGRSQTQSSVIQPPLPSGPPPSVQPVSSSRTMAVSSATLLGPSLPTSVPSSVMPPRMLQPPLPPGPPPASSIMAASSQISNSPDLLANSFSSLLNSLMAQGFLKASEPTPAPAPGITPVGRAPAPTPTPAQAPAPALAQEIRKLPQPVQRLQVQNKDGSIASISSELAPVPATTTTLTPSENEASIFKYCSFPAGHSGPSSEIENMIGIDFNPEKIRTFHQYVIDWLYGDLMHQCSICGLRLKDEENLEKHSDWHASKSHKMSGNNNSSRKWSLSLASWVKGGPPSSLGSMSAYDGGLIFPDELPDSVVPADENQWICAFCGEAFEDFYSDERDEWMFKGAAYMAVPSTDAGIVESSSEQHLIVHAHCMPNTIQMSDV